MKIKKEKFKNSSRKKTALKPNRDKIKNYPIKMNKFKEKYKKFCKK